MGAGGAGVPLRELGLVFLVACVITYLATGVVRSAVVRSGRLMEIRERDVHDMPKPRLGGVAMYTGFVAAVLLADQLPALTRGFKPVTPEMDAVVWGAFIIVAVGAIDDLVELDAATKLIGQILGALTMSLMGLSWTFIYIPFANTTVVLDQFQSVAWTTLFAVIVMNAINFVDGLDGLAAGLGGISGMALLAFSVIILNDQGGTVAAYPPAIIGAALLGICAGFLPHNFEPSRIFMGDSGAMLLGLLLAAASTSASGKINMALYGGADTVGLMVPLLVVLGAFSIPVTDLVMAVVRRTKNGRSPFSADKMHLHHRLLELGHTHRRVVLVLYAWMLALAMGTVSFAAFPSYVAALILLGGIIVAAALTAIPVLKDRRDATGRGAGTPRGRGAAPRAKAPLAATEGAPGTPGDAAAGSQGVDSHPVG
ncbi:undecaprenyl-phosphate alpha-N-acetylglucosaminyl 1-phosphate transferase [Corynebacterium sp. 13CS0277]|uniref:MraY family glycosyltransferase n=1 Tax=Corynebacterium sp. 13CS0277 TaxID=2071994 RepID=UPI000D02F78B|nr:MraY family glycosyltransferase [Corynebacterium sp. 13CS0277]PRQ12335.1 undecaprenyl-phosphate alpha-N-acetylglucosaminyl 1-phosphate transferase [Corynebacterium sp. 13CS0277]